MRAFKVGIAIGIALLLPLLANMTVRFFGKPPDISGTYESYPQNPKNEAERKRFNELLRRKAEEFRISQNEFNVLQFYVSFPIGVLELLVAYFARRKSVLAAGLLFGGLLTIACTSYSGWDDLPGVLRYSTLLFTLALLFGMGLILDRDRDHAAPPAGPPPAPG